MIQIFINNEELDIDSDTLVTFKKSQNLNGIQEQYSYSNNFTLKKSSKNRRLLGINYLPNSKAKSMTVGYSVEVILNGCVFLKKQTLKVQKETQTSIPVYLIFTDSFFLAKSKVTLLQQIDTGCNYIKTLLNFRDYNQDYLIDDLLWRTAPISCQDKSGFVVVEESVALLNLKQLLLRIFDQLDYTVFGDLLIDEKIGDYFISSNVGWYGTDGTPQWDENLTVFDFLNYFSKTFNAYIVVLDSSKSVYVYFWKNIEKIKSNFIDYSSKFTGFTEYTFEGGLSKKNNLSYSDSPDFYNGFFDNNKSIIENSDYLKSEFGAGELRLFKDQELLEDGTLPLRQIGEITEPQTINLFKFSQTIELTAVYSGGFLSYQNMYKAFSPNILEIYQNFHQAYTKNISLPTVAQLRFRYDAIMISEFKMYEVFFVKQLATYWLPLEINFSTKKDEVRVKALMIEKKAVDIPIVFDQSLSVGFQADVFLYDIFALYSPLNKSKAQTIIINNADLSKNSIFINGTQILSFPTSIDVSAGFELKVSNIDSVNRKDSSDILFQFVSQEGGVSRVAKINIAHNAIANYVSEFRTADMNQEFNYGKDGVSDFSICFNEAQTIFTGLNIPTTVNANVGSSESDLSFPIITTSKSQSINVEFHADYLRYTCSNRGGTATARTKVYFEILVDGIIKSTIHIGGVQDSYKNSSGDISESNINRTSNISVNSNQVISIRGRVTGEKDRALSSKMDGRVYFKGVTWKFSCQEQL